MLSQLQKKYLGNLNNMQEQLSLLQMCMELLTHSENVSKRLSKIATSRAAALAVSVNSLGGLPVQSQIISNKIREFSQKHNLKTYTFGRDYAVSGGYFILCSGHHVVADPTSVVGNIGVIVGKTEVEGLMDKFSLRHKQISSNKQLLSRILNPLHNLTDEQKSQILNICGWTHQKFIEHVKKYRKNKVQEQTGVFSGEIYVGGESVKVGLVDEVGSMVEILERDFPGSRLDVEKKRSFFSF